eukprot:TRINITY_DN2414_c1_g1_i3.p5 TRINITY_DN2414_c1_g1~~TRINITY_DN2414_c1_g1_i3.p5  ORF type:complete len:105 (-),score=14.93 TRINITY_DN2414_c1_g1_i3:515-829(-)
MIIPIIYNDVKEWFMLELQGTIKLLGDDMEIGTLSKIDGKEDKVMLRIGYHQLEGSIQTLKKPYAVLEKQKNQPDDVHYKVVGVVKSRILFDKQPRAIISKPHK